MTKQLTIWLTLATALLLTLTSFTNGQDFIGDSSPIVVDVQGRVQRRNRLIKYTPNFRVKGSQPFRRLQSGLCKSIRFRLTRPGFLRGALLNCSLVTVSWDTPWVTLRISFSRRFITEGGITAGCFSFYTLLRANLEKYFVCDCPDAFTGRLYIAHDCELLKVAAVEIAAVSKVRNQVNHTVLATEILRRFPSIYGLETAFRGVFLIDQLETVEHDTHIFKFYFSEHVLALHGVDVYCTDFLVIGKLLLRRNFQRRGEVFLADADINSINRAHEDHLDMRELLKETNSFSLPFHIKLDFIPDEILCERIPRATCVQ